VIESGHVRGRVQFGKKHDFYDLASLTKIIFTVSAVMDLVAKRKLSLNDPAIKYFPGFPSRKTKIKDLLSHTGGLPWWLPLYKTLSKKSDWKIRRQEVRKALQNISIGKPGKAVYSDVDFWVLGFVLEAVTNKNILQIFKKTKSKFGRNDLHFCENNKPLKNRRSYAPTEKCPWRKRTLRGEVHDDNTWAFGGVSTHAGLFGRMSDVERYALFLRKSYRKNPKNIFFKRQSKSDWAMGFMMPSKAGSSAGRYFSKSSIGHTGFTGTSIWFDPKKDLIVLVLSNRVNPSRRNLKFRRLRPQIHNAVVEALALT
jgi:CubicO group peptidase (beta-lactamase class C family)